MRYILSIILLFAGITVMQAQQTQEVIAITDTTAITATLAPTLDSTLIGVNIVEFAEKASANGSVKVNHHSQVDSLLAKHITENSTKKINGYRIRLFFDNKQTARGASEELEKDFILHFPKIPIYRTYTNPFFKIVVGDYRTKSEATKALKEIIAVYPKAIIVKENIGFPEL